MAPRALGPSLVIHLIQGPQKCLGYLSFNSSIWARAVAYDQNLKVGSLRMYYDLSVPYVNNLPELQRTLVLLDELGYNVVALEHSITGKVPATINCHIPSPLPLVVPPKLRILRRCTLHLSDPSQNHRLSSLASSYDLLALRPTTEKALQQACQSLECDIISLDLSIRFPFYFKIKTFQSALVRGMKIEICYAPGILNSDGGASRRNLISNATQLIRATRGRGIVISSQATRALACRGPADVVNLAVMWGLEKEKATEAINREARSVVLQAEMKRRSFKGVIDVVYGGDQPPKSGEDESQDKGKSGRRKRKVGEPEGKDAEEISPKPLSKREQKRRAKKARLESAGVVGEDPVVQSVGAEIDRTLPSVQYQGKENRNDG